MKQSKVLSYIANNRIPSEKAHSIYVLKMCDAFASMPFDVELVVPFRFQRTRQLGIQEMRKTYALKNDFHISRIPSPDFLPLERMLGVLSKALYTVQSLIFAVFVLSRFMFGRRRFSYITCDIWVAFFLSLCFKNNVVFDMQIIPHSGTRRLLIKMLIHRNVLIVALTEEMRRMLTVEFGALAEDVLALPDAYDESLFNAIMSKTEARGMCGLAGDAYIIGYVGKFTTMGKEKGVENLIEAIRIVNDTKCRLLLVGDYESLLPPHHHIEATVIPYIPQSRLLPYLRSCDLVTMPFPRTPHYEKCMSPMKLFEYMASGVAIISTDLPSIREIVDDNDVLFIKDNSPAEIANGIRILRDNPARAKALADSALKKAAQYTWRKRAELFISFLSRD